MATGTFSAFSGQCGLNIVIDGSHQQLEKYARDLNEDIAAETEEITVLEEILEKFGLLYDSLFLKKYPDIVHVAEVLYLSADIHYRQTEKFELLDLVKSNFCKYNPNGFLTKKIEGYLELLNSGDRRAVEIYEIVQKL